VSVGTLSAHSNSSGGGTAVETSSEVAQLSLFGGEITADGVVGHAAATVSGSSGAADFTGGMLSNLVVLGQPVAAQPGLSIPVGDWGHAVLLEEEQSAEKVDGSPGYRAWTTALDLQLDADHAGLPAGSRILIGYAEAVAVTPKEKLKPPPAPATTTAPTTPTTPTTPSAPRPLGPVAPERAARAAAPGQPNGETGVFPYLVLPPPLQTTITAGGYVFPVYGPSGYSDTFQAPRADVSGGWHHGDDIFAPLGAPVLAVAEGTVFSVGPNRIGGNRLWLQDAYGNQFYYAHLSAYTPLAKNGGRVRAGDVLGFVGNTGDAQGGAYHLHFEIHPASLLFLGYDGVVDPTPYLDAWRHLEDVRFPSGVAWAPRRSRSTVPPPGAILLQSSDISSASGLDPASLKRALRSTAEDGLLAAGTRRSGTKQRVTPLATGYSAAP
jgi:murein DD-endopeptidase MepM/ murein hydrolase activator NlpD